MRRSASLVRRLGVSRGHDVTRTSDYEVEAGDPGVEPLPGTRAQEEEKETVGAGSR